MIRFLPKQDLDWYPNRDLQHCPKYKKIQVYKKNNEHLVAMHLYVYLFSLYLTVYFYFLFAEMALYFDTDISVGAKPNPRRIQTKVLGEELSWNFLYKPGWNSYMNLESVSNPARTISYEVLYNDPAPKTLGPFLLNVNYREKLPSRFNLKIKLDASEAPEQSKTQVSDVENLKKRSWQYQTFLAVLWIRIRIHQIYMF
jgi:hypothetical protein